ncbi:DNA-binding transcriptional LysR family regulator [Psychromicrobium silvestre]|uniref:DNA-binding transcriptional LysR family regulator n=1 Tax=Psychromicrobium silvestre TaxID=1645614 RepID=A0A7Y9LTK1_9MICC|nr:LysR family transcriptional regulator [Psychromicrobium silvestre]NYE95378.1 DNA-binding transcriptional LysR family regulator [Psychromicrobium silvestre]NYE95394.1 DNA-binding transcriptional LysR family regulator [Psychromicrobium silvestre]
MSVTIAQLRAFTAVVDHSSFSAAAGALGISQSAVSHAISSLEKELRQQVLSRKNGVCLTSLGELLIPRARTVLATVDALEASVREQSGEASGVVRLAAVPTVCQGLLPELLQLWNARLPHVDVQVYEGDDEELPDWLESGLVDAAILVDPMEPQPGSRWLGSDDFRALIRKDHPLVGEAEIPLAELLEDGLISSTGGCEEQVRRIHELAGIRYTATQRVRELGTLLSLVRQGIGVGIMPSLGQAMLPEELVLLPLVPRLQRDLVLTGPQGMPWHPLTDALIEALRDWAALQLSAR